MKAFPLFPDRPALDLDGIWDFTWLGEYRSLDDIDPRQLVFTDMMAVPGVFDTFPAALGRRGIGVYRRLVNWEEGIRLRLHIGGMGLAAKLWWDGACAGDYRLPYSSVTYDFDAGAGTAHELVIAVDNRFDEVQSPLFSPGFDFYAYGGIYRSVELQQLPSTHIERVQVTTLDTANGKVRLRIILGGRLSEDLAFTVSFDGGESAQFAAAIAGNEVQIETTVPQYRIWSPESPNLHTVTVCIDGDSITERFGIRTVRTRGQEILLNGEPVRLLGVNRHEAHPEFGPVQSYHLMMEDLHLLRELGCNFVRCVHYPQDQAFLDLCDQFGILIWQESLGWNNTEAEAVQSDFFELQVEQTRLMVKNSVNHPSVILWGFLNECCSDTKGGKRLHEKLAKTIKAEDSSFLVTYASNKYERDICFDTVDVVSMNYYPGWINSGQEDLPISAQIADFVADKSQLPSLEGKPLIISEIGCCGVYGAHDRGMAQWSEEAQADYFAEACRCVLANDRHVGLALWQMFDTRSFVNSGQVRTKPFGFNLAGLLDAYRRPKKAFDVIKEIYHQASSEDAGDRDQAQ